MEEFFAGGMHWRIFNFVVFVGVLFFILRKPVREFWISRAHQIRFEMEEAGRIRRESGERHEALRKRISRIETEIKDLQRSLVQEGELERARLVQEGEGLSRRIREDGERIAAQEVRKAIEALKAQAVHLSVELAERLVRQSLTPSDQRRISERYLSDLEGEPVGRGGA